MDILEHTVKILEAFTENTGRLIAWLTPIMMLLLCAVVILRYGFDIGITALQESVTYLHGVVFMLGIAYTLKHDGHVRVDIFYRRFPTQTKAWINSLGGIIFLLPICVYVMVVSWDFVSQSWQIGEVSPEPGGIPAVFVLKSLIPLMALLLALQGIAEVLKSALVLVRGQEPSCD